MPVATGGCLDGKWDNQAMRIPREFKLEGSDPIMRTEGECLIIEPVRKGRLL